MGFLRFLAECSDWHKRVGRARISALVWPYYYLLPLQMTQLGPSYGYGMQPPQLFPQYQMPMWPQPPPNTGRPKKPSSPSASKRQGKTDLVPETPKPSPPQPKKSPPKRPLKQPTPAPTPPQEEAQPPQVRLAQQNFKPSHMASKWFGGLCCPHIHTSFSAAYSRDCYEQNRIFDIFFQGDTVTSYSKLPGESISILVWVKITQKLSQR